MYRSSDQILRAFERQDRSASNTPSPRTRTHTPSTSRDTPGVSSRPGDAIRWDLSNFPGVRDAALEPYSLCIGYTKALQRCKRPSICGRAASDAINLARGVPNLSALEEIAGNLLCSRSHQSLKQDIAKKWLGQPEDGASARDFEAPVGPLESANLPLAGDMPGPSSTRSDIGQISPSGGITPPDLIKVLGLSNRTCQFPNTTSSGNCRRKIGEERWEAVTDVLKTLAGHKLPGEAEAYFNVLRKLAEVVLCHDHRKFAEEGVKRWREVIVKSPGYPGPDSEIDSPPALEVPSSVRTVLRESTGAEPSKAVAKSEKRPQRLSSKVNTNFIHVDTKKPQIGQFRNFYSEARAREISVRDALARPLTSRELKSGYIYIYWYPGNFGYLKIGITEKAIAARLRQWKRQCKRMPLRVYPEEEEEGEKWTPHVYRVEALVKAELSHYRRKGICNQCKKEHIEWFEIPKEIAVDVAEKWRSWMAEEPRYIETRRGWVLNGISESELSRISRPSKAATESKPPKRTLKPKPQVPTSSRTRRTSSAQRATRNIRAATPQETRECECVAKKSSDTTKRLRPKKCSGTCQAKIPTIAENARTTDENAPSAINGTSTTNGSSSTVTTNGDPSTTDENASTADEKIPTTTDEGASTTHQSPSIATGIIPTADDGISTANERVSTTTGNATTTTNEPTSSTNQTTSTTIEDTPTSTTTNNPSITATDPPPEAHAETPPTDQAPIGEAEALTPPPVTASTTTSTSTTHQNNRPETPAKRKRKGPSE